MLNDLYSEQLLDAAADMPARTDMPDADAIARKVSKVCGSDVEVALKVADGVVRDIALDVKACALGQASSSLLAKSIRGASTAEVRQLRADMIAMLKEGAAPPAGERWAEMAKLEPIRDYPARHASTLLVFDAVVACLDQIEAAEQGA
ncbi:iron-sulfur cluster assembly scaffold protein [Parvularcula sp. LCG005]|uniref:iron-sulfur cluster assembly scaffold protein n=1 Tax=Parvularcula sp. LCG005 TaxID=3078805 RepID=UPI002942369E|nr:iron-sulfur cluster assembly scaffold protein [Parvularcula sp. LCG005]WOI53889.1 iron-sulfur cluster assembly scaffold protein [Parvularcula sp. LCG005]